MKIRLAIILFLLLTPLVLYFALYSSNSQQAEVAAEPAVLAELDVKDFALPELALVAQKENSLLNIKCSYGGCAGEREEGLAHGMPDTPLTSPRGGYPNAAGTELAFWLDNVDESQLKKELTELWLFSSESGANRVLAEGLYRPDIRSVPRWNSLGTQLFMVADTGEQEDLEDELSIITVDVESRAVKAAWPNLPWGQIAEDFVRSQLDVSQAGDKLAYVSRGFLGQVSLVIEGEKQERTTVRGSVPFLQWLLKDELIYAVQEQYSFSFWRVRDGVHQFVARQPGRLTSAVADAGGDFVVFQAGGQLYYLDFSQTTVKKMGAVSYDTTHRLSHVAKLAEEIQAVPVVTEKLDDGQLVAFVESNFAGIVSPEFSPERIYITDQTNTLFVDWKNEAGELQRVLLTVKDAINTEWSISAKYEARGSSWTKVSGSSLPDPEIVKLYEWENDLNQWILKETFDK